MTTTVQHPFNRWRKVLFVFCIVLLSCVIAPAQKKSKYVCDEKQPENMCNAANTCGLASSPCTIDVTRAADSANVKPGIPNAKNNQFFCIPVWDDSGVVEF